MFNFQSFSQTLSSYSYHHRSPQTKPSPLSASTRSHLVNQKQLAKEQERCCVCMTHSDKACDLCAYKSTFLLNACITLSSTLSELPFAPIMPSCFEKLDPFNKVCTTCCDENTTDNCMQTQQAKYVKREQIIKPWESSANIDAYVESNFKPTFTEAIELVELSSYTGLPRFCQGLRVSSALNWTEEILSSSNNVPFSGASQYTIDK